MSYNLAQAVCCQGHYLVAFVFKRLRTTATINREIFNGLNFCGIHSIWIFMVQGQGTIYVILRAKDSYFGLL